MTQTLEKISLLIFLLLAGASARAAEFFVAPGGAAANPGTRERPLASMAQARDAIRALRKPGQIPSETVTVTIAAGSYRLVEPLILTAADSGAPGAPVTYQAAPGETVILDAGCELAPASWQPLPPEARRRVHPKADPAKLVAHDLRAGGFKHVTPWRELVRNRELIGLFYNGHRMPLAQWPNPAERVGRSAELPGWTTLNGSAGLTTFHFGAGGQPQDGDATDELSADGTGRIQRWRAALAAGHGVWLKGFWRVPWTAHIVRVLEINVPAHTITLAANADGGMGSKYSKPVGGGSGRDSWRTGSGKEMWQALNLLEEIDTPGEYAVDFNDAMLYFYPPAPLATSRCTVADLAEPLIQAQKGAQQIRLLGLTLENGLGPAIRIQDAAAITVAGCTIRNVDGCGIEVTGKAAGQVTIQSNNISQTGAAGIRLAGLGDRANLASSGVLVANNHIHHLGQVAFDEGIVMHNCVGVRIEGNLIHDGPARGVAYYGCNNCTFKDNEIHNIALQTSDMGAFYTSGSWSTYGNVLSGNFIHHISNANGIYFDDGDSGDTAEDNAIQGALLGFLIGGGHHNIVRRNLIVGATKGAVNIDNRGISRNYRAETGYGQALRALKVDQEPWKSYYATQAAALGYEGSLATDVLNPAWHPEYPNGCRAEDNVAVACNKGFTKPTGVSGEKVVIQNNLELKTLAEAGLSPSALATTPPAPTAAISRIPKAFGAIRTAGLRLDEYRRILPDDAETGRFSDHRGGGGGLNEDPDTRK